MLSALLSRDAGVVSTQVVGEFAHVLLGKNRHLASQDAVRALSAELMRAWPLVAVGPRTIELAFAGIERFGFSYYDAQIWAAAKLAGAECVLSEDFSDGMDADGVRFVNPFAEHFDAERLLAGLSR